MIQIKKVTQPAHWCQACPNKKTHQELLDTNGNFIETKGVTLTFVQKEKFKKGDEDEAISLFLCPQHAQELKKKL